MSQSTKNGIAIVSFALIVLIVLTIIVNPTPTQATCVSDMLKDNKHGKYEPKLTLEEIKEVCSKEGK